MEQIRIEHLTFSYRKGDIFSLNDISTVVDKGQFVLIIGESGCGKTTLLRHLKVDYLPAGVRSENTRIYLNGTRIEQLSQRESAGIVGYVRQNPESAQVMDRVWHELAFGLESLGYTQEVMQRKVAEMVAFFGLEGIYEEKLCNLSGGQKQLVNLAAVMVMEPEVLVLDEPTSQLDPVAAVEFFHIVERIHRELGTTIIMTEHRLEDVYSMCDRVWLMSDGRIECEGTPEQIAMYLSDRKHVMYSALPSAARIYLQLRSGKDVPLTVREGRIRLEQILAESGRNMQSPDATADTEQKNLGIERTEKSVQQMSDRENGRRPQKMQSALCADELWFRYERQGKDILKACSFSPKKGSVTAIMGGNGTGKSTLLHVLAGHYEALRGRIRKQTGTVAMLPQNPQTLFAQDTVWEELCVSAGLEKQFCNMESPVLQDVIREWDLQSILEQHPFDLSGGQMQKLGIAKLMLADYDILLLDEPGKGMDHGAKCEMGRKLQRLAAQGKTIVLVSHDVEFCAKYTQWCGLFFDGHIVSMMDTRSFFLQNVFYTTAVVRMCRNLIDNVVTVEEVEQYFGKDEDPVEPEDNNMPKDIDDKSGIFSENGDCTQQKEVNDGRKESDCQTGQKPSKWYRILPALIFCCVMPLTIYVGHTILQQRKYYFISLVLLMEALGAFFVSYERKKPQLREMMVIAVMTAITVVGRAAFYMVPNVKPMAALTMLSGIGLGGEAGFLVGALSMLVSNIFFGQGPWTPWQMFAMGLLGWLAGLVFSRKRSYDWKRVVGISVFGFVTVFLIYGGIMNPASVLMYQEHVNGNMILSAYAMGVPFDLLHAGGTFVFLLIGTRPILKKLYRIHL